MPKPAQQSIRDQLDGYSNHHSTFVSSYSQNPQSAEMSVRDVQDIQSLQDEQKKRERTPVRTRRRGQKVIPNDRKAMLSTVVEDK